MANAKVRPSTAPSISSGVSSRSRLLRASCKSAMIPNGTAIGSNLPNSVKVLRAILVDGDLRVRLPARSHQLLPQLRVLRATTSDLAVRRKVRSGAHEEGPHGHLADSLRLHLLPHLACEHLAVLALQQVETR